MSNGYTIAYGVLAILNIIFLGVAYGKNKLTSNSIWMLYVLAILMSLFSIYLFYLMCKIKDKQEDIQTHALVAVGTLTVLNFALTIGTFIHADRNLNAFDGKWQIGMYFEQVLIILAMAGCVGLAFKTKKKVL